MNLSTNFTLREFTRSQFAARHNFNNTPNEVHIGNMKLLCQHVLQPVRNALGPLRVSSGFRSDRLNKAVGGSATSQHRVGKAGDVEPRDPNVTNLQLATWIAENIREFDQLILEYYDPAEGPHSGWVHVSFSEGNNRRQILTKLKGKPGYLQGLPSLNLPDT